MHDAAVGHQCPECAHEVRSSVRSTRTAFGGTLAGQHGHVTKTLIGVNVAVAVLAMVIGGARAVAGGGLGGLLGGSTSLHIWGGMVVGFPGATDGVVNGDYYRMITSMFLHYGVFHLLLNMWALWVVGGVLEPLLGRARFLALYLISGIGGSVAVYLTAGVDLVMFNRQLFGGLDTPTAGASGAVFGLFGAFYVFMRRMGRDTSMITMILVINIIFTFTVPAISVAGHLGGLGTGLLVALALAYAPRRHRTRVQAITVSAVAVLLVVLTLARTAALT
jgi:membrane associated rhomboid family serine protease